MKKQYHGCFFRAQVFKPKKPHDMVSFFFAGFTLFRNVHFLKDKERNTERKKRKCMIHNRRGNIYSHFRALLTGMRTVLKAFPLKTPEMMKDHSLRSGKSLGISRALLTPDTEWD